MKTYLECISVENMRESDRLTIERYVSGRTLMYRAAMGIYRAVSWHGEIAIAVGGGNNGGDGYALACILADENIPCRIIKLSEKLTEDSAFSQRKRMPSAYLPKRIRRVRLKAPILWLTACSERDFKAACASRGSVRSMR